MTDEIKQLHKGFEALATQHLERHARRLRGERVRERGGDVATQTGSSIVVNGTRHMVHQDVISYIEQLKARCFELLSEKEAKEAASV